MEGQFRVNGVNHTFSFSADETLLDVLRRHGFTDVHCGCREGSCGACAVLLDKKLVNSCLVFAATSIGQEILTVSGLGTRDAPHPIQQAFVDCGAVQCGFCTPGMILATYALLSDNPNPSDEDILRALDGNQCRCTGYVKILEAVKHAARRLDRHE